MINYEMIVKKNKLYGLDKSKRNILIIGTASSNNKLKTIVNPMTVANAFKLYGNSELYDAYKIARDITGDSNVYTINCPLFTDFIEIIDDLVHYNFDFIIPININFRDTFINPITNRVTYFSAYYLERLGRTNNKTILVMSDRPSNLYEDIDKYLNDMKKVYNNFVKNNDGILGEFGSNLVFVLNNFNNNKYSHVVLAASLSVFDFDKYPSNTSYSTYFDIDYLDLRKYESLCFYKYRPTTKYSSIEQLNNFKPTNNIYKKVLIDMVIKHVIERLDLTEFNGSLYSPYVKVKIEVKINSIMSEMMGTVFKEYEIKNITFKKTGIGVGNLIIDLAITPYSLLEKINIMMEV